VASAPVISVQTPTGGARLMRTASGDSVTTEVSLTSCMDAPVASPRLPTLPQGGLRVSFRPGRGPSPVPGDRLSVPQPTTRPCSATSNKAVKDIWLDDENDLIRSCGALSKALGLQKSFSTSDILSGAACQEGAGLSNGRHTRSELYLLECGAAGLTWGRLEANSRSLSTWVAVGDVQSSTSQLPSPQVEMCKGFPDMESSSQFTAADFVRSVNKKVRQNYIRRRLKVTYKALEQFSESDFDLEKLEKTAQRTRQSRNLDSLVLVTPDQSRTASALASSSHAHSAGARVLETGVKETLGLEGANKSVITGGLPGIGALVSQKEIERDRGKPLSKYERNIMIFDWLHTLDETATAAVEAANAATEKETEEK